MTPTAAVRSILGDPSGTLSEARYREVVVAVLRAVRDVTSDMRTAGAQHLSTDPLVGERNKATAIYTAMIDVLIEEVTAEAGPTSRTR